MSQFRLPDAPSDVRGPVKAWSEPVTIPTYMPGAADLNPMFFERRSYQGADGKIYPLPFGDRMSQVRTDHKWDAVHIENEFVRVMVLPQIGGRVHVALDKTTGYDLIYRQNVIKPALVGLAGLWISGGIEFNWPQHHRPSTFMPVDYCIEEHEDGSKTVWLSEHDPLERMKGMHGICIHPDKSIIEVKVRLYNRTPFTKTFLWWANVATHVHEQYQSFFPPDVFYVVDHAKRSNSRFPLCEGSYYGVDYGARVSSGVPAQQTPPYFVPPKGMYAPNDLSWYANIPVPTSYMCMETKEDFFGGYDHIRKAGLVHVANHHVSPGKKQWTWGNHNFGYAWDRTLTDQDGPYIELMAGVYTDNQPDFSFLAPGETKTFSQYFYPIREIGPATKANADAALSLRIEGDKANVGVMGAAVLKEAVIDMHVKGKSAFRAVVDLGPDHPFVREIELPCGITEEDVRLSVHSADGREVICYQPRRLVRRDLPKTALASEPGDPEQVQSVDELYVTGLHLDQYRQPAKSPEPYWQEALRRDPFDARCNNAMGLRYLRRGEFAEAETCFRRALERLTFRNPNPADGEPYYNLGLTFRYLHRYDEAYDALYKATWNYAWQAPAYHAIAEIDCRRGEWSKALEHLDRSLRVNTDNLRARDLRAIALERLGRHEESRAYLLQTIALDPLDWWAKSLLGMELTSDAQTRLDVALDYAQVGLYREALDVLRDVVPTTGSLLLVRYYRAFFYSKIDGAAAAAEEITLATKESTDYCFPARLEEIEILQHAIALNPRDFRAPYCLGNLLYDRRRHREAIKQWECAAQLEPSFPTVWRNLGIARFNIEKNPAAAKAAYDRAFGLNPTDARVLYERDQLWKLTKVAPAIRLEELLRYPKLIGQRDDLNAELATLYNLVARHEDAIKLLTTRQFRPWEGGEGLTVAQCVWACLALGQQALRSGDAKAAADLFQRSLVPPENLGEGRHVLVSQSNIHYWLGEAYCAMGDDAQARTCWTVASEYKGDFQEKGIQGVSEMTFYTALAMVRLGAVQQAQSTFREIRDFGRHLLQSKAKATYFTTSLPGYIFYTDLQERQTSRGKFIEAQGLIGLGDAAALQNLDTILELDPAYWQAQELLSEREMLVCVTAV